MGYIPNPLNQFDTYTYNIEVYMVRPSDSADYEQNISRGSAIPIMDNVTEARYNITNLEFISYTGFYPTRNQVQGTFNFTVYEQNGVTLLSKIKESAAALGIPNHTQAHYLVRIRFNGRDTNGAARTHQDVFTYALLFTKFTFQVDEQGTTYQIEGYENTSAGYQYINNVVQESTTVEASTVGEFVQEFERVYNLVQLRKTETSSNIVYPDQYKINFIDEAQEWLQWEFEELSNPGESTSINVVDGNRVQIVLHNGSQLTDIINHVLSLTREYKQIPTSDGGFYREAGPEQSSTATLDTFPTFFKALPEIEYGQYDPLRQDFSKIITFNIKPFTVADLVIDADAYGNGIADSSVQANRANKLIDDGLLQKRYDYLYTGSNTEVLGLDLKFDMIYYQSTALANGQQGDPNIVAPRAVQDGSTTISRLRAASSQVASLRADELTLPGQLDGTLSTVSSLETQLASTPEALESPGRFTSTVSDLLVTARNLEQQIADIPGQLENALRELGAARAQFERESEGRFDGIAYPLRFEGDVINGANHGGGESNLDGGTFQFGAVRQALENPADLLRIELYIRGDPYWLGKPKTVGSTSGVNAADYTLGGNNIFVYANLPVADEDSSTGLRSPRPDYQVTAVYTVLNIINRFQDGQFVQYLDCVLDTATNTPLSIDILLAGGNSNQDPRIGVFRPEQVNADPASAQEAATLSITTPDRTGTF